MGGPNDTSRTESAAPRHPRQRIIGACPRRLTAGLTLVAGLVLGACAIPFGSGADSTDQSTPETSRDRNRLYLQEQEQMRRQQQFDRVGPSDR